MRCTHCLTWEQRAEFGKILVRVSSKIRIEYTTVLPEGLLLTASAGLCEILVMKFSALGKQLLSRFVTSLKLSSASSKRVKNFQGNVGWLMAMALKQLRLALADLCYQHQADAELNHPLMVRAVLRCTKKIPSKEQTCSSLHPSAEQSH